MSDVKMLPGAHRPEGALSWLGELLAGEGPPCGVIVVATDSEGNIETRLFGNVRRYSLTYAGAVLTDHAMNGDFEPWPEEGGSGE